VLILLEVWLVLGWVFGVCFCRSRSNGLLYPRNWLTNLYVGRGGIGNELVMMGLVSPGRWFVFEGLFEGY
jgi:hypothetical protein